MSKSEPPTIAVDCPRCAATVSARLPKATPMDPAIVSVADRLRGTDTACGRCGHALELYFY